MELNITEIEEIPENNSKNKKIHFDSKPQISYEDILLKMGMFVSDGKLHLLDSQTKTIQNNQPIPKSALKQSMSNQYMTNKQPMSNQTAINTQNNYIYNKYFKDELQNEPTIRKPRTKQEYTQMILSDILQKQRINQIKSKKLLMPTTNINMAQHRPNNMNKLFKFSTS